MLGRADYDAVEAVEQQLDEFIRKRSRERDEANRVEEAWKESTRRVNERRRRENRVAWVEHYRQLALSHHDLAALNAKKAEALLEEPGGGVIPNG